MTYCSLYLLYSLCHNVLCTSYTPLCHNVLRPCYTVLYHNVFYTCYTALCHNVLGIVTCTALSHNVPYDLYLHFSVITFTLIPSPLVP